MSRASMVLQHPIRSWLLGAAVATPVISILQGAFLLVDYRINHGNAPYPETPSRGIVIVEAPSKSAGSSITAHARGLVNTFLRRQTTLLNYEAPLRVLVLGDSLAAGVGMSESSTPALPESIARGLSQAMGGRAVYWTCIGSPGSTSLEVVGQILDLDDLRAPLITKIIEWQQETRLRAEMTRRAAKEWWDIHKEPVEIDDELEIRNPVGRWWKRFRVGLQRDISNLRRVIEPVEQPLNKEERNALQLDKRVTKILRRQSLTPVYLGQYDIAIILCGLNDLKDSFLPFLTARPEMSGSKQDGLADGPGIKDRLVRIVHALRSRMDFPRTQEEAIGRGLEVSNYESDIRRGDSPLIVFPALPIEPTVLNHMVPLSWLLVPLVHAMDRNKKLLADMYPGLVLFVESPSPQVFSDAQEQRGSIWEELQKERTILKLSDVGRTVQNRIKGLMDEHYHSLVRDQGEDDLYQLDLDGFAIVDEFKQSERPGSSLVASDGIHPNDLGYEVWGRYIARQILEHLEKDKRGVGAN